MRDILLDGAPKLYGDKGSLLKSRSRLGTLTLFSVERLILSLSQFWLCSPLCIIVQATAQNTGTQGMKLYQVGRGRAGSRSAHKVAEIGRPE